MLVVCESGTEIAKRRYRYKLLMIVIVMMMAMAAWRSWTLFAIYNCLQSVARLIAREKEEVLKKPKRYERDREGVILLTRERLSLELPQHEEQTKTKPVYRKSFSRLKELVSAQKKVFLRRSFSGSCALSCLLSSGLIACFSLLFTWRAGESYLNFFWPRTSSSSATSFCCLAHFVLLLSSPWQWHCVSLFEESITSTLRWLSSGCLRCAILKWKWQWKLLNVCLPVLYNFIMCGTTYCVAILLDTDSVISFFLYFQYCEIRFPPQCTASVNLNHPIITPQFHQFL